MTDLHPLAAQIRSRINANERAMRSLDGADSFRLKGLTDQLRRYLDRVETAQPHELPELATLLGATMRGLGINDLIRQSAAICERVAIQEVWAA
jgi:hypothetical protein